MPRKFFDWTDENFATLKRMWLVDGASTEEIARAIGAHSRNVVIGKINRSGLMGMQGKGERQAPSAPRLIEPRSLEEIRQARTARRRRKAVKRARLTGSPVPVGATSVVAEVHILTDAGELTPAPGPSEATIASLRALAASIFGQVKTTAEKTLSEAIEDLEVPSPVWPTPLNPERKKSAGAEFLESQILAAVAEEMAREETTSSPVVEPESNQDDEPARYQAIEVPAPKRKKGRWNLLALRSCQCRWSDPRSSSFLFCGEPVAREGSSWCAEHYRRVFTAASIEAAAKQRKANKRRLVA